MGNQDEMNEGGGSKVELYIYDLSFGFSEQYSEIILGKKFNGIWHTAIVVFGKEYYFGSAGITYCQPGTTNLGAPVEIIHLGNTDVPEDLFNEYLEGLKESVFAIGTYDLLKHNCNTFTDELAQFLVGKTIPSHILELPNEVTESVVNSTFSTVATFLSEFVTSNRRTSPDFEELNNDIDAARKY